MKYYKCDECRREFDPKDGMINGRYTRKRKVQLTKPNKLAGYGHINKIYEVRKTLVLYNTIPATNMSLATKIKVNKDLCPKCVKNLEKA